MSPTVISAEHLSKAYRLGQVSTRLRQSTRLIGTGTLTYDMNLWWAKVRGTWRPTRCCGSARPTTAIAPGSDLL